MRVSLWQGSCEYPKDAPFHPAVQYPESQLLQTNALPNDVYAALRELFNLHGLDAANFGSKFWNPLGTIIRPGDRVLLKPNLITHQHPRDDDGWLAIITHGSVIRAVADYAFRAAGESGEVIVADGPQGDSSFEKICHTLGLDELARFYESVGLRFRLLDLRKYQWVSTDNVVTSRKPNEGDPLGYVRIDLGRKSLLAGHAGEGKYYGADYDTGVVNDHHFGNTHEYLISRTALECDVFINLPKFKTHKKTGITVSLKNAVGISGDRNYLPHFTQGTPAEGGDEYPDDAAAHLLESGGKKLVRKLAVASPKTGARIYRQARAIGTKIFGDTDTTIRSGNWWGNDTCWRMCLDLNRALFYANPDGTFRDNSADSRKRYLTIIDGITGGEGNGPIDVDPVDSGVLLMSTDPVAADAVAASFMGFDPAKIPVIAQALRLSDHQLGVTDVAKIEIASNRPEWCGALDADRFEGQRVFRPHFGWLGHIERNGQQ